MNGEVSSTCVQTFKRDAATRTRVALGKNVHLVQKVDERVSRAKHEQMKIVRLKASKCVVVVRRPRKQNVYVLLGVHAPTVLYDDDGVRSNLFRPHGSPVAFHLARSAMIYEALPGTVPVACSCADFVMRATSTRNQSSSKTPRSVNDRGVYGDAAIMGAVMGCKHMIAASSWIRNGGF